MENERILCTDCNANITIDGIGHMCVAKARRVKDARFAETHCMDCGKEKTFRLDGRERAHTCSAMRRRLIAEHSAAILASNYDPTEEEEEKREEAYTKKQAEQKERQERRESALLEVIDYGAEADLTRDDLVVLIRWLAKQRSM